MAGNNVSKRNAGGLYEPVYDWQGIMPRILERIAEGESINAFAATGGLPSKSKIIERCLTPEYIERYRMAQEIRAEVDGIEVDDTVAKVANETYTPAQGRVIGDLTLRRMGQRAPKKYNDKVISVTHDHKIELSISERLQRGEDRLRPEQIIDDAEYKVIESRNGVSGCEAATMDQDARETAQPSRPVPAHDTPDRATD